MATYYKSDIRRITFREGWNLTRNWPVLILWTCKVFRIPLSLAGAIPVPGNIRDLQLAEDTITEPGRSRLREALDQWAALGFHSPFFYSNNNPLNETELWAAAMLHASGKAFVVAIHARDKAGRLPFAGLLMSVVSIRHDGSLMETANRREELKSIPVDQVTRFPKASPETLWAEHQKAIEATSVRNPIRPIQNPDQMIDLLQINGNYSGGLTAN